MTLLRHPLVGELARYGLATVASAAVSFGVPLLLHEGLGVGPRLATAIGFVAAFVLNFINLRQLVYSGPASGKVGHDLARFTIVALVMRGIDYLVFLLWFDWGGLPYWAALGLTLVVSSAIKFPTYRLLVFRRA